MRLQNLALWLQVLGFVTTARAADPQIDRGKYMPYHSFAHLSPEDAMAVAAFLQSIPPIKNAFAGPFAPGDKVTTFMFRLLPPGQTAAAAPK